MNDDEREIRALIEKWLTASKAGDVASVLELMTEDAIFMVPGQAPFGRATFSAMSDTMGDLKIEGNSTIHELKVLGDWAFMRSHLDMTATSLATGSSRHRAGYTLTLFRKEPDGRWRLARDANLLTEMG
ncbi:SgcJ/EcaC family oxidoreductase [Bosea sp. 2KB_26]|uniref:YybH family protein n=1 Tax=Bosea sp. 2KB_26 TaxID=3237475 RepID=UPI003F8FC5D3